VISQSLTEPAVSCERGSFSKEKEQVRYNIYITGFTFVRTCLRLFKISCFIIAGSPGMVKDGSLYTGTLNTKMAKNNKKLRHELWKRDSWYGKPSL
jgi:hypothetical protein